MAEFIENPRRGPRMGIRCGARIAPRTGASFTTHTVDLAPGGCQAHTAQRIGPGEKVVVQLSDPKVFGALHLSGTVVWSSTAAPWACGIAFDRGSARAAQAMFDQLARAYPAAASQHAFVDRIPADAFLTPTPVPGQLEVVPLEAEVLSALGSGVEARALRARLGDRWSRCTNALFALLGRGAIQLSRPGSAHR